MQESFSAFEFVDALLTKPSTLERVRAPELVSNIDPTSITVLRYVLVDDAFDGFDVLDTFDAFDVFDTTDWLD